MLKRVGYALMLFAMLAVTGSHWAILQSVAWTSMLAENLHHTTLREAVVRTFDGQHPCCLCKQIAAGKQSEKKADFSVELKKLEFCFDSAGFVFVAPEHFWVTDSIQHSFEGLSQTPPTPPPRLA